MKPNAATVTAVTPLLSTPSFTLGSLRSRLLLCSIDLHPERILTRIPESRPKLALTRSRLLSRALRSGPSDAVLVLDDVALVNYRSTIWRLDLVTGELQPDLQIPGGRNALRLTAVANRGATGTDAYFGDYFSNSIKASASVWHRDAKSTDWRVVHTFQSGQINHIHDVVHDEYRQCFWVLTGDFGDGAGIWRASEDWSRVEPVMRGSQQFRAAWMYVLAGEIYFGTDSQLERNHLMRLEFVKDGQLEFERVRELPGSSIYGGASADGFYFSTAVEPDYPQPTRFAALTNRVPGSGNIDSRSYVFKLDSTGHVTELLSAEKDIWPMIPFQFGTFRICPRASGGAFATGQALRGIDGLTQVVGLEEPSH